MKYINASNYDELLLNIKIRRKYFLIFIQFLSENNKKVCIGKIDKLCIEDSFKKSLISLFTDKARKIVM